MGEAAEVRAAAQVVEEIRIDRAGYDVGPPAALLREQRKHFVTDAQVRQELPELAPVQESAQAVGPVVPGKNLALVLEGVAEGYVRDIMYQGG